MRQDIPQGGRILLLTALVGAAIGDDSVGQTVLYVDAAADQAPHDGSDWCHGFVALGPALEAAEAGTEIRVADGVYLPDPSGLGDGRDATFGIGTGVVLEGGYAGCGAVDPDARDVGLYVTELSGDIGAAGVADDNVYHVVTCAGGDASTRLEGVTISGGNANGVNPRHSGGGMLSVNSSPVIRDCVFRDHAASYGAGLFLSGGQATIERCTFVDNHAGSTGGAMYVLAAPGEAGPTVRGCAFVENTADSAGGAVRIWDAAPVFEECRFGLNVSKLLGGAVANGGQSAAWFDRCVFSFNRADTLFAAGDSMGGAMYNAESSRPVLSSCVLQGNRCTALLPSISYGGGLANVGSAESTMIYCTMVGQYANVGSSFYGAGTALAVIDSSILFDDGDEIFNAGSANAVVQFSNIEQGWPGLGNISEDPLLDGLRLTAGSPCIDAGNAGAPPEGWRDLDGHARELCGRADMGAYEFGIGDLDCDRRVDLVDFAHWAGCMTGPVGDDYGDECRAFDFEYDFDVDLADFGGLQPSLGEDKLN